MERDLTKKLHYFLDLFRLREEKGKKFTNNPLKALAFADKCGILYLKF